MLKWLCGLLLCATCASQAKELTFQVSMAIEPAESAGSNIRVDVDQAIFDAVYDPSRHSFRPLPVTFSVVSPLSDTISGYDLRLIYSRHECQVTTTTQAPEPISLDNITFKNGTELEMNTPYSFGYQADGSRDENEQWVDHELTFTFPSFLFDTHPELRRQCVGAIAVAVRLPV